MLLPVDFYSILLANFKINKKMNNENEECRKKRIELLYKNESQNYRLNKADADGNKFAKRQYIHLYRIRAGLLKGRLIRNARRILGVEKLTVLTDLNSRRSNDAVFVVGTIFKRMKFRRNVLYEFADDSNFQEKFTKAPSANLTDEEDVLELEENQQVLKLIGNIYKHHFVTGDTIGIYGSQEEGTDEFTVKRVILPELPQQVPWPLIEKDCYLAFISGMSLSGKVADCYKTRMALDAFQKWINGAVVPSDTEADEEEECQIVQNIARLIIAGDWARLNKPTEAIQWKKVANFSVDSEADMDCFAAIDRYLLRFMQNMPIDLMPGANDPVQCAIPQQPVPWVIFNAGQKFRPLLNAVTNPYAFSVAGLQFLGTSGQNLNDLERLTRDIPAMERMERTLKMCHLFPTVPETLDGFPFGMRDPLIIDQMPHVYFCGNQAEFGVKMLDSVENSEGGKGANSGNRCLLLAIPKFSETFEAVLLNLRTLQATPYSFNFDWDLDGSEQGDGEEEEMPIDDGGGKTTDEQGEEKGKEEKAELQEEEERPEPMDEE